MTASFTQHEVLDATRGVAIGKLPFGFDSVSTDTRTLLPGGLFVALEGERFDGHGFLGEAALKRAGAAIVRRGASCSPPPYFPLIEVESPLAALGDLARFHRRRFSIPIAAVTGSNGKTTTKEMVAAILRQSGSALATQGNLNNEIGLPLTLLRLGHEHRAAIIEMGMNHPGELSRLTRIVEPNAAAITIVAPAHLAGFADLDAVARAKGEIYEGLVAGGMAIANGDDPRALAQARASGHPVMTFGTGGECDLRITVREHDARGLAITLHHEGRDYPVRLAFVGRHNALNAAAAFALARALGETPECCVRGLEAARPYRHRLELISLGSGVTALDDCYNANPSSMAAALATLEALAPSGHRIAVLGDMLELGASEELLHAQVGADLVTRGVDRLVALGARFQKAAEAARTAGIAVFYSNAHDAAAVREAAQYLAHHVADGDLLLFKGSRGMALERVIESLQETLQQRPFSVAGGRP